MKTDMNCTSNWVFIDEVAFHINLKRPYAWSTKGSRTTVKKVPKTKARTTIIFGAISLHEIVNILVRRPRATHSSKKRKEKRSVAVVKPREATKVERQLTIITSNSLLWTLRTWWIVMKSLRTITMLWTARRFTRTATFRNISKNLDMLVYFSTYSPELNPIE